MKTIIISIFLILIFTNIFPLEINSIISPGSGKKLISDSLFINNIGVYTLNTVDPYLYFNKNMKYFDKSDSIFIISDKNDRIDIYKFTDISAQLIDNIYSDSISGILYEENLLYINRDPECEAYYYEDQYIRKKLVNRENIHLEEIIKFNNTYIALSKNNKNIYIMHIRNDTITFSLQEFLRENDIIFKNSYYLISYSKDRLIYYIVTDSSISYYTAQYVFPDIEEVYYKDMDTLIAFEKNKQLYFYSMYSNSYFLLSDSININEDIMDVKVFNDSIYILTKKNIIVYDLSYQEIRKNPISKNINNIVNYDNSTLIQIEDTIYKYDYNNDTFLFMDSIYNVEYIVDSCIVLSDSDFYFISNDTLIKHSFNDRIVCTYKVDSFLYYTNTNNEVYKFNLNTDINQYLFTSNYPIYDFIINNDTFLISSGFYGLKYFDINGKCINEEFYSHFLSSINIKDTVLFLDANNRGFYIKYSSNTNYYSPNVSDFYKTDNLFYIITKNNIFSYNDSLEDSIINTGDYYDFKELSFINDSTGLLLLNNNILLKMTNYSTGKNEKIYPIDTIYNNSYNCIYDISGRIVKNEQMLINTIKMKPGIYFVKSYKNNTKKILILK